MLYGITIDLQYILQIAPQNHLFPIQHAVRREKDDKLRIRILLGSLTPKNFEITRKASNGFIFLSNLYFLLPRYS